MNFIDVNFENLRIVEGIIAERTAVSHLPRGCGRHGTCFVLAMQRKERAIVERPMA